MSKKSFYCWYLGFGEMQGNPNQIKINECIRNIITPTIEERRVTPSKVTMSLSENGMRLIDGSIVDIKRNYRRGAYNQNFLDQTFKTYKIDYENILQVTRLNNQSEVLVCIVKHETNNQLLNSNRFNAIKKIVNYLHLFRCDSGESSKRMEQYLNHFRKQSSRNNAKLDSPRANKDLFNQSFKENDFIDPTPNAHMSNKNLSEDLLKRKLLEKTSYSNNKI